MKSLTIGTVVFIFIVMPVSLLGQMYDYGNNNYRFYYVTRSLSDSIYWHWSNPSVSYKINNTPPRNLDTASAFNAIRVAFQTWENVASSTLAFADSGHSDSKHNYKDRENIIYFSSSPSTNEHLQQYIISLTYITSESVDTLSAALIDVDIVINDSIRTDGGYIPAWSIDSMKVDTLYDIQSIITHEIGHLCGLNHPPAYKIGSECPTMAEALFWETYDNKPYFETSHLEMRSLATDDILGLNYLYGNNLQSPHVFPTLEAAFDFAQPPQSIILSEGKKVPVYTNYDTLKNKHTLESGQSLVIGKNVKLYLEDTLIVKQGAFIRMEGSESDGKDADMIFKPGSKLIIYDKSGLQGIGNITNADILWNSNFEMAASDSLIFINNTSLDFTKDSTHGYDMIIDGALVFKKNGDSAFVLFGDSLKTIYVNGNQSRLETHEGVHLLNIPRVEVYFPAYVNSYGSDTSICHWMFRYRSSFDVYATLHASHTSFLGNNWDGVLLAYANSYINIDHCEISDIYINPTTLHGSALTLYGSNNELNRITNSIIYRPYYAGATKAGDGILLQPHYGESGIVRSMLLVDSTCIFADWWTGLANSQSDVNLRNSVILFNKQGNGNTSFAVTNAFNNCIHHSQDRGIFGETGSAILFKDQNGISQTSDNLIEENDEWGLLPNEAQIVLESSSLLNDYSLFAINGGNRISHLQNSKYRISVDNSIALVRGNWWGQPPDSVCQGTYGLLSQKQKTDYFNNNNGIIDCDSAICLEPNLQYCEGCGVGMGPDRQLIVINNPETVNIGNPLPPNTNRSYSQQTIVLNALKLSQQYASTDNIMAAYLVLENILSSTSDPFIASIAASTSLHFEIARARLYPDSLSTCMSRNAVFLRNSISTARSSDVKAALEEVLCYTYSHAGDVSSAEQEVDTLLSIYPSTKYAQRILGLVEQIAMAKRDTIGINDAIAQMVSSGYSKYDILLAYEMRAAFLRTRPSNVVAPKLNIYENTGKSKNENDGTKVHQLFIRNYPNPFNPSTTIEFNLPQDSHTSVRVYNLLGRLVSTLKDEDMTAGIHRVEFATAPGTPTGMYLAVLTTEYGVKTSVMMFAK